MLNDIVEKLRQVEEATIIPQALIYRKHSAWIRVKRAIFCDAGKIALGVDAGRAITLKGCVICLLSFVNLLFRVLFRRNAPVYFGAASGLVLFNSKIVDSYFPHKLSPLEKSSVFFNAGDSSFLWSRFGYLIKHGCIVDNYLMWPAYKIVARLWGNKYERLIDFQLIHSELERVGIDIDLKIIRRQYVEYCARQFIWRLLFSFLKPKVAYVVAGYAKSEICSALKEKQIEIIEMQHGILGPIHTGYNCYGSREILPIPDKILVYNSFWKDELLSCGFSEAAVEIYGRLAYENIDDVPPLSEKYIVFTGQGIGQSEVLSFANDKQWLLKKNNVMFVYKPHPREDINKLRQIKSSDFFTIYDGIASTETLIKYAYAHVSFYSSCHFDSVYYSGKTFVLQSKLSGLMKYYVEKFPENFIVVKTLQDVFDMNVGQVECLD